MKSSIVSGGVLLKGEIMDKYKILFQDDREAYTPNKIQNEISMFQDSYIEATKEIIQLSNKHIRIDYDKFTVKRKFASPP